MFTISHNLFGSFGAIKVSGEQRIHYGYYKASYIEANRGYITPTVLYPHPELYASKLW